MKIKRAFMVLILLTLIFPLISANEGVVIGEESGAEYLDFCHTEAECIKYLEEQGMPEDFLKEAGIEIICTDGYCESVKIVKSETEEEGEGIKIVANAIADCTEGHKWCGYDNGESVIKECVDGKEETIEECDDSCDYDDKGEPVCENKDVQYTKTDSNYNTGVIAVSGSIIAGFIILGFIIRKKRK